MLLAIGFAAYVSGQEKGSWRAPIYTIALLVAVVAYLIQKLDRPLVDFVSVSQEPMIEAASSLTNYLAEIEKSAASR